jgi:hypothetical protein
LELLEMQIDTSVIMIDHSLSKASGPERASALDVLRSLKAYRVAHPRQREAGFQDLSKEEAKALVHASQQASHILSGLK